MTAFDTGSKSAPMPEILLILPQTPRLCKIWKLGAVGVRNDDKLGNPLTIRYE
jgi:hypothetical protein